MRLDQAIDEYILAGEADGLRPATRRWYQSLLNAFKGECKGGTQLTAISTTMIREYIKKLREQESRYINAPQKPQQQGGLSDETIKGHITALHAFWAWAAREYSINNPMSNIKRPRRRITAAPKAIESADFVKLLNATGEDINGIRDRAILAFLADTGCRLGGLLGLKLEHLFLDDRRAVVQEKGDKSRMVYFTMLTRLMLDRWLHFRTSETPYVFVSMNTGEKLTDSGLNQILRRLKARAGVKGRVNPHAFRHNFARSYIKNGGDLATLAKLLGHSDINTTAEYYAVFTPEELAEQHEKYSPMRNLR